MAALGAPGFALGLGGPPPGAGAPAAAAAAAAAAAPIVPGAPAPFSAAIVAAIARGDAAEASVADRAGLEAELVRVREEIARRPLPPPVAAPVAAPLPPIITGREPPIGTPAPQGSNITIQWDARGTPGPWILRIDYDRANPDFQEVTAEGPIVYTVKRQGALLGTIYSVTVV